MAKLSSSSHFNKGLISINWTMNQFVMQLQGTWDNFNVISSPICLNGWVFPRNIFHLGTETCFIHLSTFLQLIIRNTIKLLPHLLNSFIVSGCWEKNKECVGQNTYVEHTHPNIFSSIFQIDKSQNYQFKNMSNAYINKTIFLFLFLQLW